MPLEEAKRVATTFGDSGFVPPPRTIKDISELLEPTTDTRLKAARLRAESSALIPDSPPAYRVEDGKRYHRRAQAARRIGRFQQAIDDFTRAAEFIKPGQGVREPNPWQGDMGLGILRDLAETEAVGGSYRRAIEHYERAIRAAWRSRGWLFELLAGLAELYASTGDLGAAGRTVGELRSLSVESHSWGPRWPEVHASYESAVASGQATVLELRGRFTDAEVFWRQSIAVLAPHVVSRPYPSLYWIQERFDARRARLATCLLRQGRLLEAETEARQSLRDRFSRGGLFAYDTTSLVVTLARILRAQGRYQEAELLARAAIRLYDEGGASPVSSPPVTAPRRELAALLVAQGRWEEALREYATVREQLQDDRLWERLIRLDLGFSLGLLRTGRPEEAGHALEAALATAQETWGASHPGTAEARGLRAMARVALGDRSGALQDFSSAIPVLLDRTAEVDDEETSRGERTQRRRWILTAYIDLVAGAGDPAGEAFRLADVARGRVVQRAVDEAAARRAAKLPGLAELVRQEQDAAKQIGALHGLLTTAVGGSESPGVVQDLRARISALQRARTALAQQIARDFPAYGQLVNPMPLSVEQVQRLLRPGEALIATLVAEDQTYVWAVPERGRPAVAVAPIGEPALTVTVQRLRQALEPRASTLGGIPPFDVREAHEVYRALLEPVRSGWEGAEHLLVVNDGPLGQLPFAVLPTAATSVVDRAPLFSGYRRVQWLVRRHAVTTLPSVSALATRRTLPAGIPGRRPFVGFGDPYFNAEQARADLEEGTPRRMAATGPADVLERGSPLLLRGVLVSPTAAVETSRIGMLPRLPDTADELRSMAEAMGADPDREVFLGLAANERAVKTGDLAKYRVVAFATHGLVPGDLDGLTQPALAFTAPEVARIDGDGLLTMEEILALRLDADWVVLSACNTANGAGTGAEALSGLARAFLYAGARTLMVTHWPVETTSARALTTDLFRRQATRPGLRRAQALQEAMNWLIDEGQVTDAGGDRVAFSYAHPIFWAPFAIVGDGGGEAAR
jgi:CHAT domain-containing protein/tetratricopeptide (TPR) repeat protein